MIQEWLIGKLPSGYKSRHCDTQINDRLLEMTEWRRYFLEIVSTRRSYLK
jgi:hypothetical protein